MKKSITTIYLDDDVKAIVNKEIAKRTLKNPKAKKQNVSQIIEELILKHLKTHVIKGENTLILGGK